MVKRIYKIAILCLLFITMSACSKDKSKENEPQTAMGSYYSGFFLQTNEDNFFVAEKDTKLFKKNEIIRIYPADEEISFYFLNTGDKINVHVITVGTLNPKVMPIYSVKLLEVGDISNIDNSVISEIKELGYTM